MSITQSGHGLVTQHETGTKPASAVDPIIELESLDRHRLSQAAEIGQLIPRSRPQNRSDNSYVWRTSGGWNRESIYMRTPPHGRRATEYGKVLARPIEERDLAGMCRHVQCYHPRHKLRYIVSRYDAHQFQSTRTGSKTHGEPSNDTSASE